MTASSVDLRGFGYRPAGRAGWAVQNLDLSVEPGERVLMLGSSGSGKSTTLRAIAGLLDHGGEQVGSVQVDGVDSIRARHRVGLLLQDPDAQLVLSRAGDDVAFGPQNSGCTPDVVASRVAESLASVGFPYGRGRSVTALSGGERQRLALAGVLALRPGVLLLDEPTSLLDPEGAELVRQAVSRVVAENGATLLVVEHQVSAWLPMVDRVVILTPEGVAADGSADLVSRDPAAQGTWLVPDERVSSARRATGEALVLASHVAYRHRRAEVDALRDVSAVLRENSVLAISGQNGSGKSTLARLLGGLQGPTEGSVMASTALTGPDLNERRPFKWRARTLAGRIGSVFQNPEHAFLTSSVHDELSLGPRALGYPSHEVAARVDELLVRMRLEPLAAANPFTLSGGEQRRLSVAAALASSPRVMILDEPTFGQDPETWRELADLVDEMRDDGASLAVVSHDTAFRRAVGDQTLTLADGRRVDSR